MSDLSTLASFALAHEADVARRALEISGIASFVDERRRLRVATLDVIRAGAVLDTRCDGLVELAVPDEDAADVSECRVCGSTEVASTHRALSFAAISAIAVSLGVASDSTATAFFALLAAAVFLLITDRWRCLDCGATWNE